MNMKKVILVSRNQMWRVNVRQGLVGLAAVVSHGGSVKEVFTGVAPVTRALRYAKRHAAENGDEVIVRKASMSHMS